MVVELCISLRPECFVPGERIFKEQTSCDRLFVTERGLVWYQGRVYGRPNRGHLVRQSQNTATILKHPKRHWIGTLDMFSSEGFHRHDAYALTYCVMLSLQEEYLEQ